MRSFGNLPQVMKTALSLHEKALEVAGTKIMHAENARGQIGRPLALNVSSISEAQKGGWGYHSFTSTVLPVLPEAAMEPCQRRF